MKQPREIAADRGVGGDSQGGGSAAPLGKPATPGIRRVPIGSVHADPANARKHGPKNLAAIAASLAKFGQQRPILVGSDDVVIAGSGTLEAARGLGWEEIDVLHSDLSGHDKVAFGIADNRTAELAEWDHETLAIHARELRAVDYDVDVTGWLSHAIDNLIAADWTPAEVGDMPDRDPSPAGVPSAVKFDDGQRERIGRACVKLKAREGDESIPVARCIDLICGEFADG